MTPFEVVNWSLCVFTAAVLAVVLSRDRFLLVKPSVWVVVWFHVVIQWAAAVEAAFVEAYLPFPWTFAGLVHGFPLATFVGSAAMGRGAARRIFYRATREPPGDLGVMWREILATTALIAAFVAVYLSAVGVERTGLYAVLFDPSRATLAREESLKLIDSRFIRYGYAFMASALAPITAGSMATLLWLLTRRGRLVEAMLLIPVFAAVLLAVSMTGARGFAANLLLVVLFTYFVRQGFAVRPFPILGGLVAVLLIPTAITLLREGQAITAETFREYFAAILDRAFVSPMKVGVYYVHYAQTKGLFGIGAVPKVAGFLGVVSVDASNVIGLEHVPRAPESISAGGAFVFSYYSYFGAWVFPLCCVATWTLDLALVVYRGLSPNTLVTCVAAICASAQSFTAADFTPALVTHGFVPLLVLAVMLDRMCTRGTWSGPWRGFFAAERLARGWSGARAG